MTEPTPRINANYLEQFLHQTVRVVGKVVSLHGDTATLDADGSVVVHLPRDVGLKENNGADVIGKVQPDLSIKAFVATDFGPNIDLAAANAVVEATHRYKEIFYKREGEF